MARHDWRIRSLGGRRDREEGKEGVANCAAGVTTAQGSSHHLWWKEKGDNMISTRNLGVSTMDCY